MSQDVCIYLAYMFVYCILCEVLFVIL